MGRRYGDGGVVMDSETQENIWNKKTSKQGRNTNHRQKDYSKYTRLILVSLIGQWTDRKRKHDRRT